MSRTLAVASHRSFEGVGLWVVAGFLVALATFALPAPTARAANRQSAADLRQAKRFFGEAELHYRRGDFALALEKFKEALKHARRPSIILNIAQCYRHLGDASRAVLYYRLYLSEWNEAHPGSEPQFKDEVQQHIRTLGAQLERSPNGRAPAVSPELEPPPPPTQDAVTLDEAIVPAQLDPEDHATGQTKAEGALFVFGSPVGAIVRAAGKALGTSTGGELETVLAPGTYELEVEASGFLPWHGKVTIASGGTHRVQVQLSPIPPPRSVGWLVAGIATATVAVGAEVTALVFTVKANKEFKQSAQFDRFKDAAIVSHVFAGSFAVASAICWWLYYRSIPKTEQPRPRLSLLPTAGGAMAGASLTF